MGTAKLVAVIQWIFVKNVIFATNPCVLGMTEVKVRGPALGSRPSGAEGIAGRARPHTRPARYDILVCVSWNKNSRHIIKMNNFLMETDPLSLSLIFPSAFPFPHLPFSPLPSPLFPSFLLPTDSPSLPTSLGRKTKCCYLGRGNGGVGVGGKGDN